MPAKTVSQYFGYPRFISIDKGSGNGFLAYVLESEQAERIE